MYTAQIPILFNEYTQHKFMHSKAYTAADPPMGGPGGRPPPPLTKT